MLAPARIVDYSPDLGVTVRSTYARVDLDRTTGRPAYRSTVQRQDCPVDRPIGPPVVIAELASTGNLGRRTARGSDLFSGEGNPK